MSIPDITEQRSPLCRVAAGEQLDAAWHWLCDARKDAPANADIWHLRHHWLRTRDTLLTALLNGEYRLQPMLLTKKRPHQERQVMWGAQDALVLKWTAVLITPHLDLHPRCEHVKGHGGGPQSVHRMHDALTTHNYAWVCRTDVKGYYRHINKDRLMGQIKQCITDPVLQGLIHQYLHYTVEDGGEFHTPESGIARGCALSPLMGALHLYAMDAWFGQQMEQAKKNGKPGIYYARYMDDVVILAHTRWQLRKQVRALNQFFNEAGFCQHPDKTFIGRTARGYDWMGAQMSDVGVEGIAHRARANHLERLRRLYEQVRRWPAARRRARMSQYRAKWKIWAGCVLYVTQGTHAYANIGSGSDIAAGIDACMRNGAWKNLPNGQFGGDCTINLSAGSWVPTTTFTCNGRSKVNTMQFSLYDLGGQQGTNTYTFTPKSPVVVQTSSGGRWSLPSGAVVRVGQNTAGVTNTVDALCWLRNGYRPTHPSDTLGYDYGLGKQVKDAGVGATGTLTWSLNIAAGTVIRYPQLLLQFDATSATNYGQGTIALGGSGNVDPTPPDPPLAGDKPNCTSWAGNVGTTSVDLGTASPTQTTNVQLSTSSPQTTTVGMTCTSGGDGSIATVPQLFVTNVGSNVNADGITLTNSGDWLGLRLKLPASAQGTDTVASGQALGQYVKWKSSAATPIWNWHLSANATPNSNVPVNTLTLTPEIWQIAARNSTDGTRSYQVQYSVVIP